MKSRGRGRNVVTGIAAVLAAGALAGPAAAQDTLDANVQNASPPTPFSQNKQNEPAIAIDQRHPDIVAAGANDNIDMEACNAGTDNTCPFTDGVGVSGISFSSNGGKDWHQPQYSGLSARVACQGEPGDDDPPCTPQRGPIGTLPKYYENDLVSDGDPALAFGPAYVNGHFTTTSRLYYANLAAPQPGTAPFKGAEAIAVSRTDDVTSAMAGNNSAWMKPVIASHQTGALFSDKEQIWADNASRSPHYGNVYVCYAAFRGNGPSGNQPLDVLTSHNGGSSWTQHQVTSATNNPHSRNGLGRSGCTVRTDSHGVVYVFDYAFGFNATSAAAGQIQMIKSTDGGDHWARPVNIFRAYDTCNYVEPSIGRCVEDGVGGARSDLSPAPSVDIANNAPSGTNATNRIVISWVDGRDGLNHEHVMFSRSSDGGSSWSTPVAIERPNPLGTPAKDRGYYSAPAISPNGQDVYVVYNAFDTPFRSSTVGPGNDRQLVGVVLHAGWQDASSGVFRETHRGMTGDARGSSQNDLAAEFLGDYVYAAATNDYGTAVWNDVREASDCQAIDLYRQSLHDDAVSSGQQTAEPEEPRGAEDRGPDTVTDDPSDAPDVQQECVPPDQENFGNSDIFGGSWAPAP